MTRIKMTFNPAVKPLGWHLLQSKLPKEKDSEEKEKKVKEIFILDNKDSETPEVIIDWRKM